MDGRGPRGRPGHGDRSLRAGGPRPAAAEGALPTLAGGSQELDEQAAASRVRPGSDDAAPAAGPQPEVALVAIVAGAAILFFGILPQPLFNLVHGVGRALGLL